MAGRWVGLNNDGKVITGWGSMAKEHDAAEADNCSAEARAWRGWCVVTDLCEVVITAPDPDWLLDLTRQLVTEGLCASVHNFAPVRSVYRWRGEVHERTEGRASLHTRMSLVSAIVERVKAGHPYEVPGISARPIVGGNPDYLQWMVDETDSPH